MIARLAALFLIAAAPASALDLSPPGGALTGEDSTPAGSMRLPDAPWSEDAEPAAVDGAIRRQAYRYPGATRTTLQLLAPLRDALEAEGFQQVFACETVACGGFDFRFQLDILGEPQMHVDLGDYRYALFRRPDDARDPHTVAIVTSRGRDAGFVHVTSVAAAERTSDAPADPSTDQAVPAPVSDLAQQLVAQGHVVLADLEFPSGTADLTDRAYPSLAALADWLLSAPGARLVLVGHTDAIGSAEANTALSQRRAEAVARRLTDAYGVPAGQIQAAGAGFLSPLASNLDEAGRATNRRVEAVLLSLGD